MPLSWFWHFPLVLTNCFCTTAQQAEILSIQAWGGPSKQYLLAWQGHLCSEALMRSIISGQRVYLGTCVSACRSGFLKYPDPLVSTFLQRVTNLNTHFHRMLRKQSHSRRAYFTYWFSGGEDEREPNGGPSSLHLTLCFIKFRKFCAQFLQHLPLFSATVSQIRD